MYDANDDILSSALTPFFVDISETLQIFTSKHTLFWI